MSSETSRCQELDLDVQLLPSDQNELRRLYDQLFDLEQKRQHVLRQFVQYCLSHRPEKTRLLSLIQVKGLG